MTEKFNRRTFTKTGAAMGAATAMGMTAAQAQRILGANERIRLGMIGIGNRGQQLLDAVLEHQDAQVVAFCDIYKPSLEKAVGKLGGKVDQIHDFRELIERPDIDAVVIASPDHWHAIQTIAACDAGKDVYVEKPLSITIHEGRQIVNAARRNDRVVQVGTHRRSSGLWQKVAELIHADTIGKVTVSRAARRNNMYPNGIGKMAYSPPPPDLDWDLWLGPRPARPYQDNIAPYKFRWWHLYSSQMSNWGVHYFDVIRWCINQEAPASVCAMGGQFAVDDDRTIPDTAEAIFQFDSGHLALFSSFEASGTPVLREGELELRGTKGTLYVGGTTIHIVPERGGQFQNDRSPRMEPMKAHLSEDNHTQTAAHFRNFFDCIKSRERPNADVEFGHRSTTMSLLANISLATKSRLEWDAEQELITTPRDANDLLHYDYRQPWKLG